MSAVSPSIHSPALRWQTVRRLPTNHPGGVLRKSLLDSTSLTRRLQSLCAGRFRVQVLRQRWARARRDETQLLGLRHGRLANLREVRLLCDGRPWVYARSIIPATTLRGKYRRLARLGSRSLGTVLFTDKRIWRGEMQLARFMPGQPLFARATADSPPCAQPVWGRRSLFYLAGGPLLLTEIFLHELCCGAPE